MYDPQTRALPDLAINIQTTSCNAIQGIITHPHLPPRTLDRTISDIGATVSYIFTYGEVLRMVLMI
jgi:hypothetical protein